ncbi:LOB domain-containing protein 37-like [Argentina anserina]|uniref:LOB domain-containing protein 37-like n=1 Tax=Argentina anserina TaxID=57926 RepID=UPI002176627F|nr:LOB domain-containing protein 37-like [Potentilla anserina]XP_050363911.1 LOB domain-containing protein 37-like [Potentilla anserina]
MIKTIIDAGKMSCNGCRILRKGCSENCMLRQCIEWIEDPQAQSHATVFVAKFFGRASLLSFINAVSENQRPALFQSLLFEAVGRTINPVNGATGLLLAGNWKVCQAAVETVLNGGALEPLPEYSRRAVHHVRQKRRDEGYFSKYSTRERRPAVLAFNDDDERPDLNLSLKASSELRRDDHDRAATPSSVEGSETTTFSRSGSSSADCTTNDLQGTKLLRLFI